MYYPNYCIILFWSVEKRFLQLKVADEPDFHNEKMKFVFLFLCYCQVNKQKAQGHSFVNDCVCANLFQLLKSPMTANGGSEFDPKPC